MNFWQRTLITVLVFLATAGFFPTYFHVSSVWIACLAAIILGLLNMFTDHSDDFRDLLSVHQRLYVGADLIFGRKFI